MTAWMACVQLVWSCDFRKLQLYMGQKLEHVVLGLCRAASCVEKKGHRPGQKAWSSGLRERPTSHLVQGRSVLHGLHGFKCSWLWRAWGDLSGMNQWSEGQSGGQQKTWGAVQVAIHDVAAC